MLVRWRFFSKPGGPAWPAGRLELYSPKAVAGGSHIDLLSFLFFFRGNFYLY